MPIIEAYSLCREDMLSLSELANTCQRYDNYIPPMYWPQWQSVSIPSLFLYKEAGTLIGFLKLFFFSNNRTEMVLLVAPYARQQGVASRLYKAAHQLLTEKNCSEIRFSISSSKSPYLESKGAVFIETEYVLNHPLNLIMPAQNVIQHASTNHIQDLIELDILCFRERSLTHERVQKLLNQTNYQILVIEKNGKAIGKLHLKYELNVAYIFDVAIHPDHQRQGHANTLLKHALAIASQSKVKKVELEVISNNESALQLYLKNGFTIEQSHHYWSFSL